MVRGELDLVTPNQYIESTLPLREQCHVPYIFLYKKILTLQ